MSRQVGLRPARKRGADLARFLAAAFFLAAFLGFLTPPFLAPFFAACARTGGVRVSSACVILRPGIARRRRRAVPSCAAVATRAARRWPSGACWRRLALTARGEGAPRRQDARRAIRNPCEGATRWLAVDAQRGARAPPSCPARDAEAQVHTPDSSAAGAHARRNPPARGGQNTRGARAAISRPQTKAREWTPRAALRRVRAIGRPPTRAPGVVPRPLALSPSHARGGGARGASLPAHAAKNRVEK